MRTREYNFKVINPVEADAEEEEEEEIIRTPSRRIVY